MSLVFKLCPAIKNYDWGKLGTRSLVAELLHAEYPDHIRIDKGKPYAEMWIGTHPSGPAVIPSMDGLELTEWLHSHPECLGDVITRSFPLGSGLPFLFKVLSVNKPLSIQAHPNIETAVELHKKFPEHYPDSNHKPEMAIALTEFEALCGFRPISEIKIFFSELGQLQELVGVEIANEFLNSQDSSVKPLFEAVMKCSPAIFLPVLVNLLKAFKLKDFKEEVCIAIRDVFIRTVDQYPGDVGNFCFFFFNYLRIQPGEAIFLAANEPHAYLYGDCMECMACSDNVVRAGLTPKYRDVQTLCDILTYECKTADENKFTPITDPNDSCVKIYQPPVREFAVDEIHVEKGEEYVLKTVLSASLLLVVRGSSNYKHESEEGSLSMGSVLFISSQCKVTLLKPSEVLIYRAYCNG